MKKHRITLGQLRFLNEQVMEEMKTNEYELNDKTSFMNNCLNSAVLHLFNNHIASNHSKS